MYEYSVWHDPRIITNAINRWPPARVCYTCVMERDAELNSVAIAPQMTIDHYEMAGVEGTFSLELTLWDSSGTQLNANDEVDVGVEVTVKAEMNGVDSTDDTLVITVSTFFALVIICLLYIGVCEMFCNCSVIRASSLTASQKFVFFDDVIGVSTLILEVSAIFSHK